VFVALVIQHAKRMRRVVISSVALQYFYPFSHKWHGFRGGGGDVIVPKMRVLISLQLFSETILILRRIY
jgi:hypothetical protein